MGGLPPVARLAVSFAAGVALGARLGPFAPALALLLLPLPPIRAWLRPDGAGRVLLVAFLAGGTASAGAARSVRACAPAGPPGAAVRLDGYFLARHPGRSVPFRPTRRGCAGEVRVLASGEVSPGHAVTVVGRWREGPAGTHVVADTVRAARSVGLSPRRILVRWRGGLVRRVEDLYGPRAPLVSALTLARKEGLDPGLREAFARSGIAHLLAISGFHVGVVALLLVTLLRHAGLRPRRAAAVAAGGTWAYVALLGFPDAACRAAVILTAVAASRLRGRPPARWGPLGTALLLLLALDPTRLSAPGFQLSFAGAAGLTAWAGTLRARIRGRFPRLPDGLASATAAGVAATLSTLPIVTWHFERVSLVGIPATLAASPLVAAALPGALASLGADLLHPAFGRFLAGGVGLMLALLEVLTRAFASPGWASVWVPRTWVPVAVVGAVLATRVGGDRGLRARSGRRVALLGAAAAMVAWPTLLSIQGRGTLEILSIDVGQGDAIALRTPAGRWILVDAGPPPRGDPGAAPAVRTLRRRGVTRLELLVLTHPDLDHVGGAAAVLSAFEVGAVLEPSRATGKDAYVELLEAAAARGVPWRRAERGQRFEMDGVALEVLAPGGPGEELGGGDTDSNDASVVLAVRYGALDALLTGDAPASVEREIRSALSPGLEILKVGHHGSATSTDSLLLATTRPSLAVVSVGRGNRYGHPDPEVLARLEAFGMEIRRTDREGTLRVLGRADGSFTVEASGRGAR